MRAQLSSQRGETLVETLCALCLMVLTLGIFLGALRFGSGTLNRRDKMAAELYDLRKALREAECSSLGELRPFSFTIYDPDDPHHGDICFTVTASLETKCVPVGADGTEVSFRSFVFSEELP